jgi:hypothetical protein
LEAVKVSVAGVQIREYCYPATINDFYPNPQDRIDRWLQIENSANAKTVERIIVDIFGAVPKLVIDPCCGAGSTAVAARRLGTKFNGIELDPILAAISSLKSNLALSDISEALNWLPSKVEADWLLTAKTDQISAHILGLAILAIVSTSTRHIETAPLLELLAHDLYCEPPPIASSTVSCGDARRKDVWHVGANVSDAVLFASPPFRDFTPVHSDSLTEVPNLRLLRDFAASEIFGTSNPYTQAAQCKQFELLASVLGIAHTVCGANSLAIIEYEDLSSELSATKSIISILNAIPGLEVLEVLRTHPFRGPSTLFELIVVSIAN